MAADRVDEQAADSGVVYLYYGGISGNLETADADAAFEGESVSNLGTTLLVDDVTGDDVIDLVFGAYAATADALESGAVYVVPGTP